MDCLPCPVVGNEYLSLSIINNFSSLLKKLHLNIRIYKVLVALVLFSFAACSKNNNANQKTLQGTWKLTGTTESLQSLVTFVRSDTLVKQTETQSYYATSVAGSEIFSGNTAYSDSFFVHAVITQSTAEYYNNILYQDTTITYGVDQPALYSYSSFEVIGQDSLHFEGPGIQFTAGLSELGGAQGAKFAISDNVLTLTTYENFDDSASASTVNHLHITFTTTFTKQ
jgi:hypothetical protein